jgi:hypothetical protein
VLQGCGEPCGWWVKQALEYLPVEIRKQVVENVAFYSTLTRDACRVARTICEEREIILLSERIIPQKNSTISDNQARYFIFAVLHELVHVIKKHRPPYELQSGENKAQEEEADKVALRCFNTHAEGHPPLKVLTMVEVENARRPVGIKYRVD